MDLIPSYPKCLKQSFVLFASSLWVLSNQVFRQQAVGNRYLEVGS